MKRFLLFASLALLPLSGCGGGGSTSPQPTNKAVVFGIFGNLTTAVRGIQVTATLPRGVFPNHTGNVLRLEEKGLKSLKGTAQVFGSYSARTNRVYLGVIPTTASLDIGLGDFARLTYTVDPAVAAPPEADFQQATFLVSGPNATDISARVTTSVKLTLY